MKFTVVFSFILLLTCSIAHAQSAEDNVARLHALYDTTRARLFREDPRLASADGDKRYNTLWPDLSLGSLQNIAKENQAAIDELTKISAEGLSATEQLNRELFRRWMQNEIDRYRFGEHERPLDQLNYSGSVLTTNETAIDIAFDSTKDYEDWIARLNAVDSFVDQTIALMREGLKHKNVNPRHIMERARKQLKAQLVDNPDQSPFFEPFKNFPASMSPRDRGQAIGKARIAIRDHVVLSYKRLDTFLEKEYLPKCRNSVGIWDTPNGADFYRNRIAWFTTTNFSADEIHDIGL
ncbi:MAG TPA: DUF885 family protein, partial [Steroidobacteraceae bacterium]|nr:DUF885 family protein [Steroidobacteraceae bacterium]